MGRAALFHLANRGVCALGIEQHRMGHSLGSSSSPSRGFRKASFAHSAYVKLANSAQALWGKLEKSSGRDLLKLTSALLISPPEHPAMKGMIDSARQHDLPHETLSAKQLEQQFPVLRPRQDDWGLVDPEAGVLLADECNAAHLDGALASGAIVREQESVTSIDLEAVDVVVRTVRAEYRARRVVVTAGPWLPKLLGEGMNGLPGLHIP